MAGVAGIGQPFLSFPCEARCLTPSSHPSHRPGQQLSKEGLRVQYVPLDVQRSVGAKRNLAIGHCTGDVVVHWDDDDLYGATRLREQVSTASAVR